MSRADISAVNRQFEDAARTGDLDRLAALYTRDAIALPPESPIVRGQDNIKQMWGAIAQQIGFVPVFEIAAGLSVLAMAMLLKL